MYSFNGFGAFLALCGLVIFLASYGIFYGISQLTGKDLYESKASCEEKLKRDENCLQVWVESE